MKDDQLESREEFFRSHAISMEVARARPYVHFDKHDLELIRWEYRDFNNNKYPRVTQQALSIAGQESGVLIVRHGFIDRIPPQVRPDNPVFTSNLRKPSYHPSGDVRFPALTKSGQKVWPLPSLAAERHVAKKHGGINVEGLHFHREPAKYVLPPGLKGKYDWGKRLDVHPLAWPLLKKAQLVFFVIEGSLKNDAILSYIRAHNLPWAVVCVPSVTLWEDVRLHLFARLYLTNKDVVIVPDADWAANGAVIAQAMLLRSYLTKMGVRAEVAAPPIVGGEIIIDPVVGKLKGIDDYLASGRSLDDIDVLLRETPGAYSAMRALYTGFRSDRIARNVNALTKLPLYADADGCIPKSIKMLSRILGCGWEAARNALTDLEEAGVCTVDRGSLDASYNRYEREKDGRVFDIYEWDDPPLIRFHEDFRVIENTMKLGDWIGAPPIISRQIFIPEQEAVA